MRKDKLCPPSLSKSSFARSKSSVGTQKRFFSPWCTCYTRMQAISKDSYLARTLITTSGQSSFSRIRLVALMRISIQLWFLGLREFASKKHLVRFGRFCTVCRCAHNTDIQTTERATYSVTRPHLYAMHAMRPTNNNDHNNNRPICVSMSADSVLAVNTVRIIQLHCYNKPRKLTYDLLTHLPLVL